MAIDINNIFYDCYREIIKNADFKDVISLSQTSKRHRRIIENESAFCFDILKSSAKPDSLLDREIKKIPSERSSLQFRKLYKSMQSYDDRLKNSLTFNPREIRELFQKIEEEQQQELQDTALLAIWPRIADALYLPFDFDTAEECRAWFLQNQAELDKIGILDFEALDIKVVPSEVFLFKNVKILGLHNNQLEFIPAEISKLQKLEWLFISKNQIKALPDTIVQLENLQLLTLIDNKIEGFSQETLKFLSKLRLDVVLGEYKVIQ